MFIVSAHAVQAALHEQLTQLGFHLEASRRGIWGARWSGRRRGIFGWRATAYCLTCSIDERRQVIQFWDAAIEKRGGLLAPSAAMELAGATCVRKAVASLAQSAGWEIEYRLGSGTAPPPRVFTA
jgi:hypothetical protein